MSFIRRGVAGLLVWGLSAGMSQAQKFFPDDPLTEEPELVPTTDLETRDLSDLLELVSNVFGSPGERHPEGGVIPAEGVNTLDEVMDGPWYVNRHGRSRRMTREALMRGPGADHHPPKRDGIWEALTVKPYGTRTGILIADSSGAPYMLRFDPKGHLEMATGATMVASRFFYALGYHVPENYIVYFEREQLVASELGEDVTSMGGTRDLQEEDIDRFLEGVAIDPERGYRAVASRIPVAWEGFLGPYQVFGTRTDDPNDIVSHEHRRDLRGLFVFSAWLNHAYVRAVNTMDVLIVEDDLPFVRHYLIDFTATLGSGGTRPKEVWEGNESVYDPTGTGKNILSMGIYTPRWMRAQYARFSSVGNFEYETFDPERWRSNHDIAPFANRLPDDNFWAAKKVMAFTDDDIAAIVSTGEYSDPEAEAWIVRCLIERRSRIGRTYLSQVLALDDFVVSGNELHFSDLEIDYGIVESRQYTVQWSTFDNYLESHRLVATPPTSFEVPSVLRQLEEGAYMSARILGGDPRESVLVYLRRERDGVEVVGLERDWPGKRLAQAAEDVDTGRSRYIELEPRQKELFEPKAEEFNRRAGRSLTAQEYFDSLSISERTTFDAVTHALMRSQLSDEEGNPLGTALDLLSGIERIAGQYYGRSGDLQFRLYVDLAAGTMETLDRSREFRRDHENTVYHVGYPASFRQGGKVPSIQFSVSEDGDKADIDVDYRSSKMPQALWNGHLTADNSDVRAGDNHKRHNNRWGGFIAWWKQFFGSLPEAQEDDNVDLLEQQALKEAATPLPPDRARGAFIEKVDDAAQEFLTDWLVRRKVEESLDLVSDRALACVDTDDDVEDEVLSGRDARETLREIMEAISDELGDRDTLTEAIDAVLPWDPSRRVLDHPFEGDFALIEMTNRDAAVYLCSDSEGFELESDDYGSFYGVLFQFKVAANRGGVLGLLWMRENGNWRIVSYEAFEP